MPFEKPISAGSGTSAEQKLKSKNAAKLCRFGTPKLRDMLREKCRIRMKEAREQAFSHSRAEIQASEQILLKDILRQELADLDHDITIQDEIYNELENEVHEWLTQQYEEEQDYIMEVVLSNNLICPICQVSHLVIFQLHEKCFNYRCKCNANFNFPSDVKILRAKLSQCVDEHEQKCVSKLNFFVNPLTEQLEGICDNCDYFCTL